VVQTRGDCGSGHDAAAEMVLDGQRKAKFLRLSEKLHYHKEKNTYELENFFLFKPEYNFYLGDA
jgi:hypothetical protein